MPTRVSFSIKNFQEGDETLFHSLYDCHNRLVVYYCRRFASDVDALEDLVQDTWARAFEKRHTYRGDNFASWILKVARTVCLNRRSEGQPKAPIEAALEIPDGTSVEEPQEQGQGIQYDPRTTAVLRLPLRQRQTLLLRYCAGLSVKECADVLGCQPGTVRAATHQAVSKLRAMCF